MRPDSWQGDETPFFLQIGGTKKGEAFVKGRMGEHGIGKIMPRMVEAAKLKGPEDNRMLTNTSDRKYMVRKRTTHYNTDRSRKYGTICFT